MIDKKLLEQLALAKEAGTKAMAKDFFAPVPGAGEPDGDEAGGPPEMGAEAPAEGGQGDLSPEQLEELMRMLESQGGGTP